MIGSCVLLRAALIAGALSACGSSALAQAAPRHASDADFDAALGAPARAPVEAVVTGRWQALRLWPTGDERARLKADLAAGRVDAGALMAQLAGPLPLPPGARPVPCANRAEKVAYTLGLEGPVDYMNALAEMRAELEGRPAAEYNKRGPKQGYFEDYRNKLATTGTGALPTHNVIQFLTDTRGFRIVANVPDFVFEPKVRPAGQGLRITYLSDSYDSAPACFKQGVRLPAGPLLFYGYQEGPQRGDFSDPVETVAQHRAAGHPPTLPSPPRPRPGS